MEKKLKEFSELFFDGVDEYIGAKGIDMLTFFGKQIDRGFDMPIDFAIIEFLAGQIEDGFINQLEEYPVVAILSEDSDFGTIDSTVEYLFETTGFDADYEVDLDLNTLENLTQISKTLMSEDLRIIYFDGFKNVFPFAIVKNSNVDRILEIYNSLSKDNGYKLIAM